MEYVYIGLGIVGVILIYIIIKHMRHNGEITSIDEIGETDLKNNYFVLSDLIFHDGIRNAKISKLIINQSGLHAVMMLPYQGKISGTKHDKDWRFEHKGIEDTFENPLNASYKLKVSIDKVLKKDLPVYRYIVFPNKAELKMRSREILFEDELIDEINKHMKSKKKISVEDVKNTYELFKEIKDAM